MGSKETSSGNRGMRIQVQFRERGLWALSGPLLTRKSPLTLTIPGPGWWPEDIVWTGDYQSLFTRLTGRTANLKHLRLMWKNRNFSPHGSVPAQEEKESQEGEGVVLTSMVGGPESYCLGQVRRCALRSISGRLHGAFPEVPTFTVSGVSQLQ